MGRSDRKKMRNHLKVKRKTKDLDEIDADLEPTKAAKLLNQDVDYDMPGNAQFYCIHCSRYFIDDRAMKDHFKTKVHKRRLKALETEPYSLEEAERAAGMGSYVPPKKRKMTTQDVSEDMEASTEETDKDTNTALKSSSNKSDSLA